MYDNFTTFDSEIPQHKLNFQSLIMPMNEDIDLWKCMLF